MDISCLFESQIHLLSLAPLCFSSYIYNTTGLIETAKAVVSIFPLPLLFLFLDQVL